MKAYLYIFFTLLVASSFFSTGCKKKLNFTNGDLNFSQDTVLFDTVFTTIGSTTQSLRVYNKNNNTIKIDEIRLMGGENSPFRINVDGISSLVHNDVEIPKKDSIYAFVQVELDVNNGTLPMIVEDSIQFTANGKVNYVKLAVWGQDAYFHSFKDSLYDGTTTIWPNDKPHVIYGVFPVLNNNTKLIIQQGTDVFLHKSSILAIVDASLDIQGELNNPVTFQGDRLEAFYDDVAGQYYGIYFQEAQPSTINHAIIKNGTAGIHVFGEDPTNTEYTLDIKNTEIYNCASYGIFNYSGGKIKGENLLVHSNGLYAFFLLEGGDYNFKQSHFLGYGAESGPSIAIKNYFTRSDNITYIGSVNEGVINNSILWGNADDAYAFDTISAVGAVVNYSFENNIIKKVDNIPSSNQLFVANLFNQNPLFTSTENKDFTVFSSSPVINNGNPSFPTHTNLTDILGNSRTGVPDIGAYEF